MHAFVEWPCVCRQVCVVRIGPEATQAPKPYEVSVTCRVVGYDATPIGFNAPAGGFRLCHYAAGRRALQREGLTLRGWERLTGAGTLRQVGGK